MSTMVDAQLLPAPEPAAGVPRTLEAVLMEGELRAAALPTKIIGYMDMLGFGALVRKHPGSFNIEISDDGSKVGTSTSKSSERFGRFHAVLDRTAMDHFDASRPERMMIFSDCAFAVYDNALQAAVSLAPMMRQFLAWSIPVRMSIKKGVTRERTVTGALLRPPYPEGSPDRAIRTARFRPAFDGGFQDHRHRPSGRLTPGRSHLHVRQGAADGFDGFETDTV